MSYIDVKFVSLLSPQLEKFTRKNSNLWNMRCPICGDSQKNKNKARGFIYQVKQDLFYKCHNCSYGTSFANFLKRINKNLYDEYLLEKYKDGQTATGHRPKTSVPSPKFNFEYKRKVNLKSFADLDDTHPAKKLFVKRMIPEKYWNILYYAPKFYKFASDLSSSFTSSSSNDHPRIVIPFYNKEKTFFAFQGRAFGNEEPKYLTIVLNKKIPKIFGMERIVTNKPLQIVEGPIDSLFLDNGVAVAHGDLRLPEYIDNSILIPDNEPRNKEICSNIEKYLKENYKVVLWPNYIKFKDINEMIQNGMSKNEIQNIINKNTYSGLEGIAVFSSWKKIN
jgi:hypothetical protein